MQETKAGGAAGRGGWQAPAEGKPPTRPPTRVSTKGWGTTGGMGKGRGREGRRRVGCSCSTRTRARGGGGGGTRANAVRRDARLPPAALCGGGSWVVAPPAARGCPLPAGCARRARATVPPRAGIHPTPQRTANEGARPRTVRSDVAGRRTGALVQCACASISKKRRNRQNQRSVCRQHTRRGRQPRRGARVPAPLPPTCPATAAAAPVPSARLSFASHEGAPCPCLSPPPIPLPVGAAQQRRQRPRGRPVAPLAGCSPLHSLPPALATSAAAALTPTAANTTSSRAAALVGVGTSSGGVPCGALRGQSRPLSWSDFVAAATPRQ